MRSTAFFIGLFLNLITFGLFFFAWFPEPKNSAMIFAATILFPVSFLLLLVGYTEEKE